MLVRRIGVLCATVLMLCVLLECGCASKEPGRCYAKGFSIKIPEGWEEEANVPSCIDVVLTNPEAEGEMSISLFGQKMPPNLTREQYLKRVSSQVGYELDSGQTTIAGVDTYWLESTKYEGGKEFTFLLYNMEKGKRIYTMIFTATSDRFPDYEDEFVKVAKSFRFE